MVTSGTIIFFLAFLADNAKDSPAGTGLTALRKQPWRSIGLQNLTLLRRSVKSGYVLRSGWFFGVTLPVRQGYLPLCSGIATQHRREEAYRYTRLFKYDSQYI